MNDQDRAALRRTFRRLRRALSPEQQRHHSVAAARHFFAAGLAWRASTVGLYIANDGETKTSLKLEPRYENAGEVMAKLVELDADPQAVRAGIQAAGIDPMRSGDGGDDPDFFDMGNGPLR